MKPFITHLKPTCNLHSFWIKLKHFAERPSTFTKKTIFCNVSRKQAISEILAFLTIAAFFGAWISWHLGTFGICVSMVFLLFVFFGSFGFLAFLAFFAFIAFLKFLSFSALMAFSVFWVIRAFWNFGFSRLLGFAFFLGSLGFLTFLGSCLFREILAFLAFRFFWRNKSLILGHTNN